MEITIIKCDSCPEYIGRKGYAVNVYGDKIWVAWDQKTASLGRYHAYFYLFEIKGKFLT